MHARTLARTREGRVGPLAREVRGTTYDSGPFDRRAVRAVAGERVGVVEVFGDVSGIEDSLVTRVGDDLDGAAAWIDAADQAEGSILDAAVAVVATSDDAVSNGELLVPDGYPGACEAPVTNEQLPRAMVEGRSRVVVAGEHHGAGQPGLLLGLVPVGEEFVERVGLSLVDVEFCSLLLELDVLVRVTTVQRVESSPTTEALER